MRSYKCSFAVSPDLNRELGHQIQWCPLKTKSLVKINLTKISFFDPRTRRRWKLGDSCSSMYNIKLNSADVKEERTMQKPVCQRHPQRYPRNTWNNRCTIQALLYHHSSTRVHNTMKVQYERNNRFKRSSKPHHFTRRCPTDVLPKNIVSSSDDARRECIMWWRYSRDGTID